MWDACSPTPTDLLGVAGIEGGFTGEELCDSMTSALDGSGVLLECLSKGDL